MNHEVECAKALKVGLAMFSLGGFAIGIGIGMAAINYLEAQRLPDIYTPENSHQAILKYASREGVQTHVIACPQRGTNPQLYAAKLRTELDVRITALPGITPQTQAQLRKIIYGPQLEQICPYP